MMGHNGVAGDVETSQLETNYALSALQSATGSGQVHTPQEDTEELQSLSDYDL